MSGAEIEQIKSIVVDPLKETLAEQTKNLTAQITRVEASVEKHATAYDVKLKAVENRVDALESTHRKALLGYGGIVFAVTLFWNIAWSKFKKMMGWE